MDKRTVSPLVTEGFHRFENIPIMDPVDGFNQFVDVLQAKQEGNNPENRAVFNDGLNKLSKEAKEVVKIVFNTPSELVEFVRYHNKGEYKITMDILRDYLRHYGWKHHIIEKTFKEIKKII
jgi:hypothetical protein